VNLLDQNIYDKLIDSGADIPTLPLENVILVTAFRKRSNIVKKQVMIQFSIGEICLKLISAYPHSLFKMQFRLPVHEGSWYKFKF
jgi:hypothetical protein